MKKRQRKDSGKKNILLNKIYGRKKSKSIKYLELFYRLASILFCGILIYLLLLTVSSAAADWSS